MITLDKIEQLHDLREELDPEIIKICEELLNHSYRNAEAKSFDIEKGALGAYFINCYGTETCMGHTDQIFESYPIELFINSTHEVLKDYTEKQIEDTKKRQEEAKEEARVKAELREKAILRNLLNKYPEAQAERCVACHWYECRGCSNERWNTKCVHCYCDDCWQNGYKNFKELVDI